MNNLEAIVLARLVLDRRIEWELIALGSYFHGQSSLLTANMLTGVRRLCWTLWQGEAPPEKWAEAPRQCARDALRMFAHLGGQAQDAIFMLGLIEESDGVLSALFDLERKAHELRLRHRQLLDEGFDRPLELEAERSDESPPPESGIEVSSSTTASIEALFGEPSLPPIRELAPIRRAKTDSDRSETLIQGATALKGRP